MLKLRGLPFDVRESDISSFFQGYSVLPESVIIGERSDGRRTGEGVVLFKSEQDAIRAQGEKKGQNIGRRYIEIFVYPFSNYS